MDVELTKKITSSVNVPVIAHGGAGSAEHIKEAITIGGASSVAMVSMVVYQKQGMGVLINFPNRKNLI